MAENKKKPAAETEVAETEVDETEVAEVKPASKPKKVRIKLPLTRTEKEDVFVALNGKTYQIKRGVEVEVPYGVAKILERQEKQLAIAMEFEEQAAQGLVAMADN